MEKASQAKDAIEDTLSSAAKQAAEYTAPAAKAKGDAAAKSATGTANHYVGEKTVQAKDVTEEKGKGAAEYAGKAAGDLKDKATTVLVHGEARKDTMNRVAAAARDMGRSCAITLSRGCCSRPPQLRETNIAAARESCSRFEEQPPHPEEEESDRERKLDTIYAVKSGVLESSNEERAYSVSVA